MNPEYRKRRTYTAPPNAVWNAGKRKADYTISIKKIKSLIEDSDSQYLKVALEAMQNYQKELLKV